MYIYGYQGSHLNSQNLEFEFVSYYNKNKKFGPFFKIKKNNKKAHSDLFSLRKKNLQFEW